MAVSYCELIEAKMRLPENKVSFIDEAFRKWVIEDPEANSPIRTVQKLIELIKKYPTLPVQSATLSFFMNRVMATPEKRLVGFKMKLCEVAEVKTIQDITGLAFPFILEYFRAHDFVDGDWL